MQYCHDNGSAGFNYTRDEAIITIAAKDKGKDKGLSQSSL